MAAAFHFRGLRWRHRRAPIQGKGGRAWTKDKKSVAQIPRAVAREVLIGYPVKNSAINITIIIIR